MTGPSLRIPVVSISKFFTSSSLSSSILSLRKKCSPLLTKADYSLPVLCIPLSSPSYSLPWIHFKTLPFSCLLLFGGKYTQASLTIKYVPLTLQQTQATASSLFPIKFLKRVVLLFLSQPMSKWTSLSFLYRNWTQEVLISSFSPNRNICF